MLHTAYVQRHTFSHWTPRPPSTPPRHALTGRVDGCAVGAVGTRLVAVAGPRSNGTGRAKTGSDVAGPHPNTTVTRKAQEQQRTEGTHPINAMLGTLAPRCHRFQRRLHLLHARSGGHRRRLHQFNQDRSVTRGKNAKDTS